MGNTATTANCYFYSQLVYEKGHWTSCFPLLSYRVEARSTDFVKTTTRTGYRYGCSWTGLQLVSTVLAFAIVWKCKHSFCTLPLLTHIQLKESCTEFSVMLPFFFFKAVFVALWFCFFFSPSRAHKEWATLSTERKKLQVCRSTTTLPTQTETTVLLCTPLQLAGEQIKKLSLQNKLSLLSSFFFSPDEL